MKVRDLIELLQQQNPEYDVYADSDGMCEIVDVRYETPGPYVYLLIAYPMMYEELNNGKP